MQVCTASRGSTEVGLAPHMVSLVTKERWSGRMQLMTQGSADFVLDSCVDAWTGQDLSQLTPDLRKKCLEFHHRASLTSYCTAFAYRPLPVPPSWPPMHHLELPASSTSLPAWPSQVSVDCVSCSELQPLPPNDAHHPDLEGCLEIQNSQSLLGMVQMQYQARVDMVQFIDLLEKACIRFVHFSKENELRSRVFSEKMGLESGWNCHISLAPGVNLTKATSVMYGLKEENKTKNGEPHGKLWPRIGLLGSSLPAKLNVNNRVLAFPGWREKPLLAKGKEVAELN